MPRITGTTDAQTTFLRAFRQNPTGPAPADWPHPSILRRWLRRPTFVTALNSILETFRFQVDFQLASNAAQAVRRLISDSNLPAPDVRRIAELLRLSHLRQRFPAPATHASPATFKLRDETQELEDEIQSLRQERQTRSENPPADDNEKIEDQLDNQYDERCEQELAHRLQYLKSQTQSRTRQQSSPTGV